MDPQYRIVNPENNELDISSSRYIRDLENGRILSLQNEEIGCFLKEPFSELTNSEFQI